MITLDHAENHTEDHTDVQATSLALWLEQAQAASDNDNTRQQSMLN